ncbi:13605_t:CDS:2, partial [Funneliformis geosporum]
WLLTAHSEALLYMMNDSGIMGTTIRLLRIQQLQYQEWLYQSPLILGNTPISSFIQHNYRGIAKELRRYSLLFMKQLVKADDNQMLTFYDYCRDYCVFSSCRLFTIRFPTTSKTQKQKRLHPGLAH